MLLNVLKTLLVICIYCSSLAVVIYKQKEFYLNWLFEQKFSVLFAHNKTKLLVLWGNGTGEQAEANRIRIAAKRLGLVVRTVSQQHGNDHFDYYTYHKADIAANKLQPDLIITIERNIPAILNYPNYLVLDQSSTHYIIQQADGSYALNKKSYLNFTGLLPTFADLGALKQAVENSGKQFYGLHWYPTVFKTSYKPQQPSRLFYPGGSLTDPTRSSDKYVQIFSLLDNTGYFEVHGQADKWLHTPNSFRGFIPFDPVTMLALNNQAGVTLILHAEDHLNGGVPTGRIFEAAAANTVIISDDNSFIRKHFGDNVLYIDVKKSAPDVFRQIDQHMQWIFQHPQKAQQMANQCHAIFLRKFTMEDQLLKLIKLNQTKI